jgi:hypothetical protein
MRSMAFLKYVPLGSPQGVPQVSICPRQSQGGLIFRTPHFEGITQWVSSGHHKKKILKCKMPHPLPMRIYFGQGALQIH